MSALETLNSALQQHWKLGKNILLCWSPHPEGIQILLAPHYFLGQFSASLNNCDPDDRLEALNGRYVRQLISGSRMLSRTDFSGASSRLQLSPVVVPAADLALDDPKLLFQVDELFKRYSLNYVKRRAVLLLDIVDFSLASPFEQSSQLNSLSYSLNSALNKLRQQNSEISFCRSTTGDGYYIWHQQVGPKADLELFELMTLVVVDNALAQRAAADDNSSGTVVPKIRTGFHVGSHFEFYQVEGLNPTMNSFIVGDVTIELARMLELASPGQIVFGDFDTRVPTSYREGAYLLDADSQRFVEKGMKQITERTGLTLSGQTILEIHCFLTGETGASGGKTVRRFKLTDKHGRSRSVYNLRINIRTDGEEKPIILGLPVSRFSKRPARRRKAMSNFFGGDTVQMKAITAAHPAIRTTDE